MRKWINFPHREGTISRQAHADLPAEGIYEREVGRSGFFGPATHLHHKHPPTGWSAHSPSSGGRPRIARTSLGVTARALMSAPKSSLTCLGSFGVGSAYQTRGLPG